MSEQTWTVVLKRGRIGDKRFVDKTEARARQRAASLADLHAAVASVFTVERLIEIDARKYYEG